MTGGTTPPLEDRDAADLAGDATRADLGSTETSENDGGVEDHAVATRHGEVAAAGEEELGIDSITAAHAPAGTSNDGASADVEAARPVDEGAGGEVTVVVDASQPGVVTIKIKGIGGRCG